MNFDVAIVGSGLAGLSVALDLANDRRVVVISKRALRDGASDWAQGGIAAVLDSSEVTAEIICDGHHVHPSLVGLAISEAAVWACTSCGACVDICPVGNEPMRDILFDEKIAGSFHFTPGQAYDDCGNGNKSQVHWDMVCIQRPEYGGGEVWFDDKLIRKDGLFVPKSLQKLNPEYLLGK